MAGECQEKRMSEDLLSGNTEMLPMVSRSEEPKPSVLLLTPEHTEFLWFKHLLTSQERSVDREVHWCSDLRQLHELMSLDKFDVILWDCGFRDEDPIVFLGFLSFDSDQTPVVCISSEPEESLSKVIFQAGGTDYLCKSTITSNGLERSSETPH